MDPCASSSANSLSNPFFRGPLLLSARIVVTRIARFTSFAHASGSYPNSRRPRGPVSTIALHDTSPWKPVPGWLVMVVDFGHSWGMLFLNSWYRNGSQSVTSSSERWQLAYYFYWGWQGRSIFKAYSIYIEGRWRCFDI
jgi:hypothetical protein